MTFATLAALAAPPVSIKMLLHARLAGYEEPRPHFPLRASDLLSSRGEFCPREHAFMDMGLAKKKAEFIGTALRMTFNHGRFMEEKIRNDYLADLVVGQWECAQCNCLHPTFGKRPTVSCTKCGAYKRWLYQEPRFADPVSGVSGGIDFLLDTGATKAMIVEIKTMAPDDFKVLAAPLAEHKWRTALYLKLASDSQWSASERVNTNEARILYVTKSFGFKDETMKAAGLKDAPFSPFKEFTVKRDDTLLEVPLRKAIVLKKWRDDQKGMPCGVCSNGLTKRAQSCPAVAPCWSGKHPATTTWLDAAQQPVHAGKIVLKTEKGTS